MSNFELIDEDNVEFIIESSKKGLHRTLEGQMVKIGSPECRNDIVRRMEDMGYHRNDQSYGSDARAYFSGVLKVLRRKLRENDKVAGLETSQQDATLEESCNSETKLLNEDNADRILKLAGLIR